MTDAELLVIGKDLRDFAIEEHKVAHGINGSVLDQAAAGIAVVRKVVVKINEIRAKFSGITDEQAQALAVNALQEIIDSVVKAHVGGIVGTIYSWIPVATRRGIAKMVVDFVVNSVKHAADDIARK